MTAIIPPYAAPGYYSPHFSKREMCSSETAARQGIDNTPPPHVESNLVRVCSNLENIRARYGPIRVTSGFRCPELNALIGGSTTSAHPDGRAVDFHPLRATVTLKEVVRWLIASPLDVDQVILEFNQWVHMGIAKCGEKPRREALMIFRGSGYLPYDENDPRVSS